MEPTLHSNQIIVGQYYTANKDDWWSKWCSGEAVRVTDIKYYDDIKNYLVEIFVESRSDYMTMAIQAFERDFTLCGDKS